VQTFIREMSEETENEISDLSKKTIRSERESSVQKV